MHEAKLLQQLMRYTEESSEPVVQKILEMEDKKEFFTDAFLKGLTHVRDNPREAAEGEQVFHLFALLFLAYWRDKRACAIFLSCLEQDEDAVEGLFGEVITDFNMFASFYDGNFKALTDIIDNAKAPSWHRSWALSAVSAIGVTEVESRQSITDLAKRLFADGIKKTDGQINSELIFLCLDNNIKDYDAEIKALFKSGKVDKLWIDEELYEREKDSTRKTYHLFTDLPQECANYEFYSEEGPAMDEDEEAYLDSTAQEIFNGLSEEEKEELSRSLDAILGKK